MRRWIGGTVRALDVALSGVKRPERRFLPFGSFGVTGALSFLILVGCAVGPAHRPPVIEAGPTFREAPDSVPVASADSAARDSVTLAAQAPPAAGSDAARVAFW